MELQILSLEVGMSGGVGRRRSADCLCYVTHRTLDVTFASLHVSITVAFSLAR